MVEINAMIKKIKAIGYDAETFEVANFLRSYIDDNMPNLNVSSKGQSLFGSMCDKNGFYQDILNTALKDINTSKLFSITNFTFKTEWIPNWKWFKVFEIKTLLYLLFFSATKSGAWKTNESIFIPLGAVHRIQNKFKTPLKIIEAQVGSILKETDIVRFQDIYGRVK